MSKSPDAFRTISEVADWLDTPAHVLRFWESKFSQVKPIKRAGGRRYYRPADMQLLGGIKRLLHQDGLTIKDVQALLREKGAKHIAALSVLDFDSNDQPTTIENADQIEISAAPTDEPVFTSIAPRAEQTPADDDEADENQMSFPGFEFASDRAKTFERAQPAKPERPAPQTIDITHIPQLDVESITAQSGGILTAIAGLSVDDLKGKDVQITSLRAKLEAVVASCADSAKS